jgi:DNA-binding Lrp family transcriptional regulator
MTEADIRLIKALQEGIPLTCKPFAEIARQVGSSEDDVIGRINEWKSKGIIRRFGAVLQHISAGYSVNVLAVWNVPDERVEEFGLEASAIQAITHCYERPRLPGFPYNVYTMIHGKSKIECETVVHALSKNTGISDYALLYTTAEYKKTSPVYFAEQ